MSKCAQKKAQPQRDIEKPKIQAARQKRNIHDISPDEVEEFDVFIQDTTMNLEIPVEPAVPCVSRTRIPTAKAQTQKVALPKVGGRDPQH